MQLSEYHLTEPLPEIVDALCDPKLEPERDRDDVDKLIINFVIKYLAVYLGAKELHDPESVRDFVRREFERMKAANEGFDVFKGTILGMTGQGDLSHSQSDMFGIQCHIDVHTTAALAREIMFHPAPYGRVEDYMGVDLGSGTGILMASTIIAGKRREVRNVLALGIDRQLRAVERSRTMIERLFPRERNCHVEQANILAPGLMKIFEGLPLHMWISETISTATPKFHFKGTRLTFPSEADQVSAAFQAGLDPFPFVAERTLQDRSVFAEDVRQGKTAMFPDIINRLYRPDGDNSTLKLLTGENGGETPPLHELGSEFRRRFGSFVPGVAPRFPNENSLREAIAGALRPK